MMVPISITILATLILTTGAHARAPMEPQMDNNASNELIGDDAIAELDKLSALNKYLDKVIAELEDIDNLLKDGSADTVAMPVSHIFIHRIEIKYLR